LLWSSHGSTVALLIATPTTSGSRSTLTFVDLATRSAIALPDGTSTDGIALGEGAWSGDGAWLALPTSPSTITIFDRLGDVAATVPTQGPIADLEWSADGEALAFREGDRLVVADRAGNKTRSLSLGKSAAFGWDQMESDLLVARPARAGVVVDRYRADDLEWVAQATSTVAGATGSSPPSPTPSSAGEPGQICLQLDKATAAP
jgi:hypothetical protein